ncbi:hypothetical protein DAPPUDRAFT_336380 [Daphnia pulex]|uniref:Uncharacterized protein n=1 Tax=Daphnia pulex TaxID=6669 RepID=E9HZK5_DAPPU|nr:hypothetical protein DAPPUDRAFT_336380 [Daphnia pulex]|eukprot:EFX62828.1 hypothetical protein DAPPUDRAFT_336380 [Daphnia pulex]
MVYYTTTYVTPRCYTETPKYCTGKAEYYTTTFAAPVYYTEKLKYFSAPSNYRTEAPVDYTIYAPGFYSTPYAAPIYTTKAHTTKAPELLLRLLRPSAPKLRIYYIMVKPEMETVYYTEEFKYYSSPNKYQTEAPVYYTTIALECYTTTNNTTPNYYTVAPKCYTSMHNQFAIDMSVVFMVIGHWELIVDLD